MVICCSLGTKEPAVEEPCVVKRYADLTENEQNSDGKGHIKIIVHFKTSHDN